MTLKKTALFLASPSAPHMEFWLNCLLDNYNVTIIHVHELRNKRENVTYINPLPDFLLKLGPLKYIFLGLWCRYFYKSKSASIVNAHSASGYGTAALVSGTKYIITTYGSEIFDCKKWRPVYTKLVSKVLAKSELVICSSIFMEEYLESKFSVSMRKIVRLPQPIDPKIMRNMPLDSAPITNLEQFDLVFTTNRRCEPLYRNQEILHAFTQVFSDRKDVCLVVIEGHSLSDYYKKLKAVYNTNANVMFLDGFIPLEEFYTLIKSSDVCISAPLTDQLSSSILETLMLGAIPALSTEPYYKEFEGENVLWINEGDFVAFFENFRVLDHHAISNMKDSCADIYKRKFSFEDAKSKVQRMYESVTTNQMN